MESIGKVFAINAKQGGTSASSGKDWYLQSFVIETLGNYPIKQCFEIFGEDNIAKFLPQEGATIKVSFNLSSREVNGRWYTSARVWKTEPYVAQAAAQPMPTTPPASAPAQAAPSAPAVPTCTFDVNTNLPF